MKAFLAENMLWGWAARVLWTTFGVQSSMSEIRILIDTKLILIPQLWNTWCLFWDDTFLGALVKNTNLYAQQERAAAAAHGAPHGTKGFPRRRHQKQEDKNERRGGGWG